MAAAAARRPWGDRANLAILFINDIALTIEAANLDTSVSGFATIRGRNGCAHDPRGGGDDRLVAPHAALRGARGARRARPFRVRLPPLRPCRAAAPAHAARAARPARDRPL